MIHYELLTVLTIDGVRKAPIAVIINKDEINIDHRIDLIAECCKNRQKYDEVCKAYKKVTTELLDKMRSLVHGAPKEMNTCTITSNDTPNVMLEFKMIKVTSKSGE